MRCCQLCLLVSFGLRVRGISNGTPTAPPRADNATSARRRLSIEYQEISKLVASDAAADDRFGISVAIDGSTIVVGASQPYNGGSGSAYVRTTDGGATYDEVAKLTASDAASNDSFGQSVAIDGNTIVVGAYYKSSGTGAVYVLRTSDGGATYVEVAKLTAADAYYFNQFGRSVAIDGNTVVAGAPHDDDAGSSSGSAYVFHTTDGGATYAQVAKLTAADAASGDYFGYSVAIAGDTIVIGAYGDKDAGSESGSAYVYRTSDGGATYGQVAKLTAADGAAWEKFGFSVAIDGSTVVVGAYEDDGGGTNSGSAYVFRTTDGITYSQVAKLTADDAASNDSFGYSVAIDGATIVVGAVGDDDAGSASGSVYVFLTTDGGATYDQIAKLTASRTRWRRSRQLLRRRRAAVAAAAALPWVNSQRSRRWPLRRREGGSPNPRGALA